MQSSLQRQSSAPSVLDAVFPGSSTRQENSSSPVEVTGAVLLPDKSYLKVKLNIPMTLTGMHNYSEWDARLRGVLEAYDAVDALTDDSNPFNKVVKLAICSSVNSAVFPHIQAAKTAKEAYTILKQLFGQQSQGNLQTSLLQYRSFQMQPKEDITSMYARFTQLVSAIKTGGVDLAEVDQCMVFINALPEEFQVYKKMLMMNNTQKLNDIVMACTRAQGEIMREAEAEAEAIGAKNRMYWTAGRSNGKQYGGRSSGSKQFQFKGNCNYCKEEGHMKRDCHKLAQKKAREQEEEHAAEKPQKSVSFATQNRFW